MKFCSTYTYNTIINYHTNHIPIKCVALIRFYNCYIICICDRAIYVAKYVTILLDTIWISFSTSIIFPLCYNYVNTFGSLPCHWSTFPVSTFIISVLGKIQILMHKIARYSFSSNFVGSASPNCC